MKRKFCLTPNPSQAGLDIPSVPKVMERFRDIRLDREISRKSKDSSSSSSSGESASDLYSNTATSNPSHPKYPDDIFNFEDDSFRKSHDLTYLSQSAPPAQSIGCEGLQSYSRLRNSSIPTIPDRSNRRLPTVFKWEGGGKSVYLSGSFDHWKSKIPMAKSHGDFYTILELPEGEHQFKFLVDNNWTCDPNLEMVDNELGTKNNVLLVNATDFEVFEALDMDSSCTTDSSGKTGSLTSPSGEYSQTIPTRNSGHGGHHGGPPILPPHLLQVILNKEIPLHCEPTLLPEPNHVMLNHLYALSIKDGVMVLSATHRHRKKYVTTLLYKPIQ